ncbi:glutamate racemase [Robertkochia solimangrovi]|uniref:glutamate racemase n=1 Tax=Robertkochia solimangrovi TaxID=2213046 RepID=UPI00117F0284|nr:glutamate racemase [Robertkochia solimangrovi]TRZ44417.1 glutamate racemase [Robertkochia solimangrovi]
MNKQPIGIFDSGVGGTTVWREIHKAMPYESTIYLADSRNAPYGERSKEAIVELSVKNTELLLEMGSKMIVVACNTATTNAIDHLRRTYDVPFIGIEPAIKPAALKSSNKAVGVLATKGTLSSDLFAKTSGNYAGGIKVVEQMGEGLVPLIEKGLIDSDEMTALLDRYLSPMVTANIDYLVLGCTHYPYLIQRMREFLPESVAIIDSGAAVARRTKFVLEEHELLNTVKNTPELRFYTNADEVLLRSFLKDVSQEHVVEYKDF